MMKISCLEFSLAKAEYLLNYATSIGEGGDKQKFWRVILGFETPAAIREAILAKVSIDELEPKEVNDYGQKYQATLCLQGSSGAIWQIKTVWIVLTSEEVARFVTAVPERVGR